MKFNNLTTEELLLKLPSHIGRNPLLNENGNIIGYTSVENKFINII